jgi:prepilin-type N-terminal cleavage/methylation domain-containing protein
VTRRTGFTLIELMVVVTILGVLTSIAVPKYQSFRTRATATRIMGDVEAIRAAATSFYVDSEYYPAEAKKGELPPNLAPYLPSGFKMKRELWDLDYDNVLVKDEIVDTVVTGGGSKGKGKGSGSTKTLIKTTVVKSQTISLTFSTDDKQLGRMALSLLSNQPTYTVGNKYTMVIYGF